MIFGWLNPNAAIGMIMGLGLVFMAKYNLKTCCFGGWWVSALLCAGALLVILLGFNAL